MSKMIAKFEVIVLIDKWGRSFWSAVAVSSLSSVVSLKSEFFSNVCQLLSYILAFHEIEVGLTVELIALVLKAHSVLVVSTLFVLHKIWNSTSAV